MYGAISWVSLKYMLGMIGHDDGEEYVSGRMWPASIYFGGWSFAGRMGTFGLVLAKSDRRDQTPFDIFAA